MLDRLSSTSASIGAYDDSAPARRGIAFQEFIHFLRRQAYVVGAVAAAVVLLAAGYVLSTPPSYTATAHLIIDSKVQLLKQQSVVSDLTADTPALPAEPPAQGKQSIALDELVDKALREHGELKKLIDRIRDDGDDSAREEGMQILMQSVVYHVQEEERQMLPQAEQRLGKELERVGAQMQQRKQETLPPTAAAE